MLLQFAEKFIIALAFSMLVVAIVNFFGVPQYFDPVILIAFFAIAFLFRRNKDLVSICAIFLVERLLEELGYQTVINIDNNIWIKVPIYLGLALSLWFCTTSKLRIFALSFLSIAIIVEVYWVLTDYAPRLILWTCFLFTLSLWVRWSLRRRAFWLIYLTKKSGEPIDLDLKLINATMLFVALHVSMVLEFYVRHVFGLKDITYVYYSYPYISQVINCFILYNILIESVKHLKAIELQA